MKYPIAVVLVIAMSAIVCVIAQTPDPLNGTWKLNVAKSKINPAELAPKSSITKVEVIQDTIKIINDSVDAQGRASHYEYTAKFDGKDYPWTETIDGKANPDQRNITLQRIDSHTYVTVWKRKGQVLTTERMVIAADGKTRTNTVTGKNPQGQTVKAILFYEKQ